MSVFFFKKNPIRQQKKQTVYAQVTIIYQVPQVAMHIKTENERLRQTDFKVTQTPSNCLIMTGVTNLAFLG